MHIWARCGGSGSSQERVLIRAHAHLTTSDSHKYRMQHVAFGYPAVATAHACKALRSALTAWAGISPIWHA
eukprot:6858830-Pyramimonas_sp.AAC.1